MSKFNSKSYTESHGDKVSNYFYEAFYDFGAYSLEYYNLFFKKLTSLLKILGHTIADNVRKFFKIIYVFFKNIYLDFANVFKKNIAKYRLQKHKVIQSKGKSAYATFLIIMHLIYAVFNIIVTLGFILFQIAMPFLAIFILISTITYFLNQNYGLQVSLYGENLGVVKDESIFEIAEKDLQKDILYQEGDEFVYTIPQFQIVTVTDNIIDAKTLKDRMIAASGSEIINGWGLYIDERFYGVVTNPNQIQNELDEKLNSVKVENPSAEVKFMKNVNFNEGVYLASSATTDTNILEQINQNVENEELYVVKEGDTVSGIASALGISSARIRELNPGLTDFLSIGQEIIMRNQQPFLSVQASFIEVYNVETPFLKEQAENEKEYTDYKEVTTEGKNGVSVIEAEVVKVDGSEISRKELSRAVVEEPVSEVTTVGTKQRPISSSITSSQASAVNVASTGQFIWPSPGGKVTCGWLCYRGHTAIDIQSYHGGPVVAADAGVVTTVTYGRYGYGYHIIINHANGYQTLYAHNSEMMVTAGQTVSKGQQIAKQGMTGNATGVHVHFEIRKNGVKLNPMNFYG